MKKSASFALFFCLSAACYAAACGVKEDIETTIDCQGVCQRYSDCFDADYDVSACRNRCESGVDTGALGFDEVDSCESCIDDRSCAGGTLNCADECAGIVP
jgi:hypothetical protein